MRARAKSPLASLLFNRSFATQRLPAVTVRMQRRLPAEAKIAPRQRSDEIAQLLFVWPVSQGQRRKLSRKNLWNGQSNG